MRFVCGPSTAETGAFCCRLCQKDPSKHICGNGGDLRHFQNYRHYVSALVFERLEDLTRTLQILVVSCTCPSRFTDVLTFNFAISAYGDNFSADIFEEGLFSFQLKIATFYRFKLKNVDFRLSWPLQFSNSLPVSLGVPSGSLQ